MSLSKVFTKMNYNKVFDKSKKASSNTNEEQNFVFSHENERFGIKQTSFEE